MAEERVQRRLAAILAADVVGFSRMMGEDEAGTLAQLKTLRREISSPRPRCSAGGSSRIPVTVPSVNSEAPMMRSNAPSRSNARSFDATRTFPKTGGSSYAWV